MIYQASVSGALPGSSREDYLSLPDPPKKTHESDFIPDISKLPPTVTTYRVSPTVMAMLRSKEAAGLLKADEVKVTGQMQPWLWIPVALLGVVVIKKVVFD